MKKIAKMNITSDKKRTTALLLVLIFLVISTVCFYICDKRIKDEYYDVIGEAAQDMATIVAGTLRITDSEFAELKSMSYKDASLTAHNEHLSRAIESTGGGMPIKFIYVLCRLDEAETVHAVTEDNAAEMGAEPGTPMEVMWLLDACGITDEKTEALIESGAYYDEINRYSVLREWQIKALEAEKPMYSYASDEWGDTVTGLAPLYTQEGTFVGMAGVDIYVSEVEKHSDAAILMLGTIYIVTTLLLCGMFLFAYQKYFKVRQQQLYVDPLTHAYNRRYLNELFKKSLSVKRYGSEYLVLVMFDIDDFKSVNDSYGHESGDMCLQSIAKAIADVLKKPPNVLIRYGGEEFLAAITVDNAASAGSVIAEILENVRKLKLFDDGRKVTVSGGAAILPYADIAKTDMKFVIKEADDNCYYCKRNGKDRFKLTDYTKPDSAAKE